MYAPKDFVYVPDPLVKANVGKHLYHLTRKQTREGILKEGLHNACVTEEYIGPVFAHNTDRFEIEWYWFCLDIYQYDLTSYWNEYINHLNDNRSLIRFYVNTFYDIWKIDTEKADKEWFIDYVGLHGEPNKKEDYYVYSHSVIDREAMRLCTLDIDVQENIENENGLVITYINPIIPRDEFIDKHGFEPEEEVLLLVNNPKLIDLSEENSRNELYWKKLSKLKFSLQEEWEYRKIA